MGHGPTQTVFLNPTREGEGLGNTFHRLAVGDDVDEVKQPTPEGVLLHMARKQAIESRGTRVILRPSG